MHFDPQCRIFAFSTAVLSIATGAKAALVLLFTRLAVGSNDIVMARKTAPTRELLTRSTEIADNTKVLNEGLNDHFLTGEDVQTLHPYGVGIDCHSKFIQVCILEKNGTSIRRYDREFPTDFDQLQAAHHWIAHQICHENFHYTLESTGPYHFPVIMAFGGDPHVVNPLLASPSRRKTDVLDARLLAQNDMTGMWPSSFIPPRDVYTARILWQERIRSKKAALRVSNRAINLLTRHGHSFAVQAGLGTPTTTALIEDLCDGRTPTHTGVCPIPTPPEVLRVLRRYVDEYSRLCEYAVSAQKEAIRFIDRTEFLSEGGEIITGKVLKQHLQTVPGIGDVASMHWMLEVVDATRFPNARAIAAYCGLDPSLKVSAGKVTAHSRRKGNNNLHVALMQSAGVVLRMKEHPLGNWGRSIWKRSSKGGWKRACGAIARRLAIALWHCHRKRDDFDIKHYKFYEAMAVEHVLLIDCGFDSRIRNLLESLGIRDSTQLAQAYATKLADQPGVGPTCLKKVREWLNSHQIKTHSTKPDLAVPISTDSSSSAPSAPEKGRKLRPRAVTRR